MKEYLAFANKINEVNYMLHFCQDTDVVWGNDWNVCPSSIVGGLNVDDNCITSTILIKCDSELSTAGCGPCFSMQDCIDGIIPMIYSNLEENTLLYEGRPFFIMFGEDKEVVKEMLQKYNVEILSEESIEDKSSEIMDSLMDDLDGLDNNSIDNFDF